jgi:glycerophosphoryl diester phosphodiesterase
VLISAHAGYPQWVDSGADFIEVDIRSNSDGEFIVSHDAPEPGADTVTFGEVLEAAKGHIGLQLDLKEPGREIELVRFALERCPADRLAVTTENNESIAKIKRSFANVRVGLTTIHVDQVNADFISIDQQYLAEDAINRIPVWVWTVDDEKLMQRFMADPRVECLITNRPDLALRLRSARS